MSETHTNSGGAYYATAAKLRADAETARRSYPEALAASQEGVGSHATDAMHAQSLILQAVGFEIAASILCLAQAIEDATQPTLMLAGTSPET